MDAFDADHQFSGIIKWDNVILREENLVSEEQDNQQVYDALENAQELYERYLELSRITEIVPDSIDRPAKPRPPLPQPLELIIHDIPTLLVDG